MQIFNTWIVSDVIISFFVSGVEFEILPIKIFSMVRLGVKPEINAFHSNYLSSRFMDNINFGWSAWQAAKVESHKQAALYQFEINHLAQANQQWREKAAKAQAVPEGLFWFLLSKWANGATWLISLKSMDALSVMKPEDMRIVWLVKLMLISM